MIAPTRKIDPSGGRDDKALCRAPAADDGTCLGISVNASGESAVGKVQRR